MSYLKKTEGKDQLNKVLATVKDGVAEERLEMGNKIVPKNREN